MYSIEKYKDFFTSFLICLIILFFIIFIKKKFTKGDMIEYEPVDGNQKSLNIKSKAWDKKGGIKYLNNENENVIEEESRGEKNYEKYEELEKEENRFSEIENKPSKNIHSLITRRDKILAFISKEQQQITNPDFRPFKNTKHAIENIYPYHLFHAKSHEDILFLNTKDKDISEEVEATIIKVYNFLEQEDYQEFNDDNTVIDIILKEEENYKLKKIREYLKNIPKRRTMKKYFSKVSKNNYNAKIKIPADINNFLECKKEQRKVRFKTNQFL